MIVENKKFNIIIDEKVFETCEGETILDVALRNKIDIPHLCKHPDLSVRANCRMCVVDIEGVNSLQTSCSTLVDKDMKVTTNNTKIKLARKFNLEMIFGQHVEDCPSCVWKSKCDLLKYRKKLNSKMLRFEDRKVDRPIYEFGPILFDQTKCIDCRNCTEVCPVNYLEVDGRGAEISIKPSDSKEKDCIYCGQCITHCPAGAIKSAGEYSSIEYLKKLIKQADKTVVVQLDPAVLSSVKEQLKLFGGVDKIQDLLVGGLRKLGIDFVFDTLSGSDFAVYESALDMSERIKSCKNLPWFSTGCPSWVSYIERYYPKYLQNLGKTRSPHIILGGVIKTYWSRRKKIDSKDIISVSITPCTAKKYEIKRSELKIDGLDPVDISLTTRELVHWFVDSKIDFKEIEPSKIDYPIYGADDTGVLSEISGGIIESSIGTVYHCLTGRSFTHNTIFANPENIAGIRRFSIKLPIPIKTKNGSKKILKVALVNTIENAKIIFKELEKTPDRYDFVEVMVCPGGCIGGGGQPLPSNKNIRQKRANTLVKINSQRSILPVYKNLAVEKAYNKYFDDKKSQQVFYTKFKQRGNNKITIRKRTKADGALHN